MKKLSKKNILRSERILKKLFLSIFVSSSFLAESGPKNAIVGAGKYMGSVKNNIIQRGKDAAQSLKDVWDIFGGKTVTNTDNMNLDLSNPYGGEPIRRPNNTNNASDNSDSNLADNLNNNVGNTNSENINNANGRDNNTNQGSATHSNANSSIVNDNATQPGLSSSNSSGDLDDMPVGDLSNIINSSSKNNKNRNNQMIRNNSNDSDDNGLDSDEYFSEADWLLDSSQRGDTNTSPARNLTIPGVHENSPSSITENQRNDKKDKNLDNTEQESTILDAANSNRNNNNAAQSGNTVVVANNIIEKPIVNNQVNAAVALDEEEVNMLGILFDENAKQDMDEILVNQILADQGIVNAENIDAVENIGAIENLGAIQNTEQGASPIPNENNQNINQQLNAQDNNRQENIGNARIILNRDRRALVANNRPNAVSAANIMPKTIRGSQKKAYSEGYDQTKNELQSDPYILYSLDNINSKDSQFLIDQVRGVEYSADINKNANNISMSDGANVTDFSINIKKILQQRNEWGFLSIYGTDLMSKAAEIAEKLAQLDVENSNMDLSNSMDKANQEKLNQRAVALRKTAKTPKAFKTKEEKIIYVFSILNMAKEQASFEKVYELLDKEKKLNPEKNNISNEDSSDNDNAIMVFDSNDRQPSVNKHINKTINSKELSDLYQEILDVIKYAFIGNKYAYPVFLEIVKKGKKLGESRLKDNINLVAENTINDKTIFIQ